MSALGIYVLIVLPTLFVVLSGGGWVYARIRLNERRKADAAERFDTSQRKSAAVVDLIDTYRQRAS